MNLYLLFLATIPLQSTIYLGVNMGEAKLNKRERYKARLRPIDYYKDWESLDFESLGEGDRFYLQDFGIFTTDFLEDEFTMRIRIPGGRISTKDFQTIADIVKQYDLTIVLTARGGIQLHDIYVDDIREIYNKVNATALTTWQSFGDNIRNIVTDAYDGVIDESEIECYDIIKKMQEFIIANPRYVGMLPRRVSIGISGNSVNVSSFFANDIYFALAKKDDTFGFNVYMGGKNTEVAQDADIFLLSDEVFDFFRAFVEAFYLHGSRFSRSKTRLFYLIKDIGMEGLKEHIKKEYKKEFVSAGEIELHKSEFKELRKLRNGKFAFVYQTNFSKLDADEMDKLASFATEKNVEIRFGIDQNIYLLGLDVQEVPFSSPSQSSTVVTCAGNLCPYAVWSIKEDTKYLPLDLIEKHSIFVGFSGCAKGCGRHRHTDIGLIGLKTNHFGDTDAGSRVFIGAEHSYGQSIGRELFSMVPFVHLKEVVTLIIKLYELSGYNDFENYSRDTLSKYSQDFVSLWHLANLETSQSIKLEAKENPLTLDEEKELIQEVFPNFTLAENFKKTVSVKCKELWTIEGADPMYKPKINRTNFR